jgi:multiple sugar transport system permease protein
MPSVTNSSVSPGNNGHAATTGGATASSVVTRPSPRISLRRREQITGLLSVAPALLLVAIVVWWPIFRSFRYSVTDWNGARANWVGLDNYRTILERGELWTPLKTNLIFFASIPGILLISLVVSVLLFEETPGWRFFRSVYYIPTILSTAIVGMLMRVMFSPRGAVNALLRDVGLGELSRNWLGTTATAFVVLIFIFYWQTLGQGVLIFLSGLASISTDVLDAARLDGANWWQRFSQVLVPLLMPVIGFFFIFNAVYCFVGLFSLIYTVTNGGPGFSTTPIDLLIYRKAFETGELGYASALAVMLFLIVLCLSVLQLRFFDRRGVDRLEA